MAFEELVKLGEYVWEVPQDAALRMRVPGRIFLSEVLMQHRDAGHALGVWFSHRRRCRVRR